MKRNSTIVVRLQGCRGQRLQERALTLFIPDYANSKNRRKRRISDKETRHFPRRQSPESKCSVNIISCAVISFKALLENNIERMNFMRSILEEFAYGNVSPEPRFFKHGSRYDDEMRALVSNEDKLNARLVGEDKEAFEKFAEAQLEINRLTAMENFIYGFKLGLLMTAEAFVTSDDLIFGAGDD
jgi:hypothetical protein